MVHKQDEKKMKKNYVYLAGPMEDCSEEHMKDWRHRAEIQLSMAGIEVLDPTRRVQFHEDMRILADRNVPDQSVCRRIFKLDMQDIASSSVVLADCRKDSGRGTGTSMELMFAHMKNKIIILWVNDGDRIHPFYEALYTEKHYNLEDAIDAVTHYYGG